MKIKPNPWHLSPEQIGAEVAYRMAERLGILANGGAIEGWMIETARREAQEWRDRFEGLQEASRAFST